MDFENDEYYVPEWEGPTFYPEPADYYIVPVNPADLIDCAGCQ